jgi:hypothetical protein
MTAAASKYTATALGPAERGREQAGPDGHDAVEPGDAGAHGDQREHVEVARLERLPAAHEERPAGPQHDRRGQRELQPVRELLAQQHVQAGEVPAHLQHDHRRGQREADPEAARHVGQLGLGPLSAVTTSGSSAMPQIGQLPGPTWRISGCMGQV